MKNWNHLLLTFLATFFVGMSFSQDVEWEKVKNPDGGGNAKDVHEDSQNRLFLLDPAPIRAISPSFFQKMRHFQTVG